MRRLPLRKRKNAVVEQILRPARRIDAGQVDGACDQLVTVGEHPTGNQRGVPHRTNMKREVNAIGDMIDQALGDENLRSHLGGMTPETHK